MHKLLKFVIWFPIVLVTAFAAGYLFWQKTLIPGPYDLEPVSIVRNGNRLNLTGNQLPETSNQLAGWQTYRNDKYGYEMKYPEGWQKKQGNDYAMFSKSNFQNINYSYPLDASITIYLDNNPNHLTIQQFFQNEYSECLKRAGAVGEPQGCGELEDVSHWQKLTIDSQIALRSGRRVTEKGPTDSVYISKGSLIIQLHEWDNLENYDLKPIFNQILSTFKFIEPGSKEGKVCIQVITKAKNPQTGETRDFPTPCDVPTGWEVVR